ncbi:4'-phosphopantetheinyl transferase [Litorivivens lipolytica]|uniref:4'-phosphopantetheinyl transferase n=1 Tax=Litorivivens lipolytica TaxID=1524264 RepID=A0A7W4W300_9GAMM|nr:4'-phosphopantetheinyl transferase superfamily protein [Litorivivens lipolytica]MBB3046522.1 4'-phosphopantetheinyl transferase [Litorivivens lipolytica]
MIEPGSESALPGGQLDIWIAISAHVADHHRESAYEAMLDASELDHYRSLQYPEHRFDYLLSRALLRTVLSCYTGLAPEQHRFTRNESGKPKLDRESLPEGVFLPRFNLSLTDGVVVCAINRDAPLGIDVEYHGHGRSMLDVADQYFSSLEIAELKRLPALEQRAGFFRYWTLKESLIKARGEGLSVPLDSFSFRAATGVQGSTQKAKLVSMAEGFLPSEEAWSFRYFDLGSDYTVAVSMGETIDHICLRESIPLVGCVDVQDTSSLFTHAHQDALYAAFC